MRQSYISLYISHRGGTLFNPLIIFFYFFVIILLYWFVTKNIKNYRKYGIFFNFRFTENMIFPSIAENHENMIFTSSVFTKLLFFCMKTRIFVWRKFVKGTEKIIFSLVFACSRFTKISYFPSFLWNENVRKQHLSVFLPKYEIFVYDNCA